MIKKDLIVIGAGTSGYIVAIGALRLGWDDVLLVDKHQYIGGAALHSNCVPSKSLLHIASIADTVRAGVQYGLNSYLLDVDFAQVSMYIQQQVLDIAESETRETLAAFHQLGGKMFQGKARFVNPNVIEVDKQEFYAKNIVIATGARPWYPDIKGIDKIGYVTNENIWKMKKLPEKLVILGGRPSAIEFAQAFSRLGSKVSLVIGHETILPQEDSELVKKLQEVLINAGIEIYVHTAVQDCYTQGDKKILDCRHEYGENFLVEADEVLVLEGRRPNFEGLALENAGVHYLDSGIQVSDQLLTSQKHIYAVGDVAATPYKLTHAAEYQANVVLSNMVLNTTTKAKFQGFPYVIFTDPEYAHTGLNEQQAKAAGYNNLEVTRFEFKDIDSAKIRRCTTGRIKIISSNNKIIGASILGPDAGNLLSEWSLAIKLGATVADVASTIYPYPSLAQVNRRVANKCLQQSTKGKTNKAAWVQRVLSWS